MWCVWWDEWLLGVCWCESEVGDACPFILLPPPCVFFGDQNIVWWWRMYLWHMTCHSSLVLVVRENLFGIWRSCLNYSNELQNCLKIWSACCNTSLNDCRYCVDKADTLLDTRLVWFLRDWGGGWFWGLSFLRVGGWRCLCRYTAAFLVFWLQNVWSLMLILKMSFVGG